MIILKINQPGLILRLSQFRKEIRTPAELNITNFKVERIVRELTNYGINDFELKTVSELEYENNEQKVLKKKSNKQEETCQPTSETPCIKQGIQLERITEKLEKAVDKINEKIQDLKQSGIELKSNSESKQKTKKSYVDDDEDFVPGVNLDGLEKKGNTDYKEVDSNITTEDSEELSKKLSGKDKKE